MTSGPLPTLPENPVTNGLILNPAEAKQRRELKRYPLDVVQVPLSSVFEIFLPSGRIWLESQGGKGSAFHFTARFKPHLR